MIANTRLCSSPRARKSLAAALLLACLMTACGGSDTPVTEPRLLETRPPSVPDVTGTGTLQVAVVDPEGGTLAGASVNLYDRRQSTLVGSAKTDANGIVTFAAVPDVAIVVASHEFAGSASRRVDVAQTGDTPYTVTLQRYITQPAAALLPVTVAPGSLSADRSELSLQVTVVASALAPFVPAQFSETIARATPALGIELGHLRNASLLGGVCSVWVDRVRTVPDCGTPWADGLYAMSVERFEYDPAGSRPTLAEPGPARSATILMDQSGRMSIADPSAARTFAVERFIARALNASQPEHLSIAGFAGGNASVLPVRPLWSPSGPAFSADAAVLGAAVSVLEPLVGGSAPVFEAVAETIARTTAHAPSEARAVVALLAGGDDGGMEETERRAALAALRRQRDEAGIQFVVIAGAAAGQPGERRALAELSAALRAPVVSLGAHQVWQSGAYPALHVAADLIGGLSLPTLSADFRVSAGEPGAFPPGAVLHGTVVLDSSDCPWHCGIVPLQFAVEIP